MLTVIVYAEFVWAMEKAWEKLFNLASKTTLRIHSDPFHILVRMFPRSSKYVLAWGRVLDSG